MIIHYWRLLWIFTFHPISEAKLHAPVALDDHLIHQRHERPQLKVHALFLFFKEFPQGCLLLNKNLASKLARRVVVATGLEPVTPSM